MMNVDLQDITHATTTHHMPNDIGAFSTVRLFSAGGQVTLFVTAAQADAIAVAFAPKVNAAGVPVFESPEPAPCCDLCGEAGEIRVYRDDMLCGPCFAANDAENSFTDFPLAEEAA